MLDEATDSLLILPDSNDENTSISMVHHGDAENSIIYSKNVQDYRPSLRVLQLYVGGLHTNNADSVSSCLEHYRNVTDFH